MRVASFVRLLLPALMPSWRFFDRIGPAPRVDYSLATSPDADGGPWQPVRPRPSHVSAAEMLARLFWNPRGNAALFLVSCAERLIEDPTPARADLLWSWAADCLLADGLVAPDASLYLRIRVVEVSRFREGLAHECVYVSPPRLVC